MLRIVCMRTCIHVCRAEVVWWLSSVLCACVCSHQRWETVTRKAVNMKVTEITHACSGHCKTCSLKGTTQVTHAETLLWCTLVYLSSGPLSQSFGLHSPHLFHLCLSASFCVFISLWPPSPSHSFSHSDIFGWGVLMFCDIFVCVHHSQSVPPCCWRKLICTHIHTYTCTWSGALPIVFSINTIS